MRRYFLIITALAFTFSAPVRAEVYFWQDPGSKLSVTVPDTWRMTTNQKPDDVLTFLAPGENDFAACRMRVRDDQRFVIYPQRFSGQVQRLNYSQDFWEEYVNEYNNGVVHSVKDNVGLGRGFASYADASYVTSVGPKVSKRAVMYGGVYNGKAYILECSAEAAAFDKWFDSFQSVAKSVDFRKEIYEFPAGNYRDFLRDAPILVRGKRVIEDAYY